MKMLIGLVIAFLVLVYVYTFIKIRKKRKNNIDTVTKYNTAYLKKKTYKSEKSNSSNYQNQITKYNSQIDYIEKDKLNN